MHFYEGNYHFIFFSQMNSALLIAELSQITPDKYLFWYLLVLGLLGGDYLISKRLSFLICRHGNIYYTCIIGL